MLRSAARRVRRFLLWPVMEELRHQRAILADTALGPDRVLTVHYDNCPVRFYLPDGHLDWNQRQILVDATFQEEEILRFVRARFRLQGAHVVDAGAAIGNHVLYFGLVCGAASCLAIEPNPRARDILERNVALNGLTGVDVRSFALSDGNGRLDRREAPANHIGGMAYAPDGNGAVEARTLDSLELKRVDFLKVDVEGMTDRVLAGAAETLARFKPPILIEIFPSEMAKSRALLTRLGYRRTKSFGDHNYLYEA